MIQLDVTL